MPPSLRRPFRVRGVIDSVERFVLDELAEGDRYTRLRPAETLARTPPRTLSGAPPPEFARLAEHRFAPVFRARLPQARIAGHDPVVLTHDGRVFVESTPDRWQLDRNPVMKQRLGRARQLEGLHLLLTNLWALNQFHWLMDTLSRAALLPIAATDPAPVIIPAGLGSLEQETLHRAGIGEHRWLEYTGEHLQVEELMMPSYVGGPGNPPPWMLQWLRDTLIPAAGPGRRRLYVSRADAATRHVVNEREVIERLARRGFETVQLSGLALDAKFGMFAEAEIVVGAHGANLTGLFACQRTRVVELFDPRFVNGAYYALAEARGLDYWALVCRAAGAQDLEVDLDALEATLDAA